MVESEHFPVNKVNNLVAISLENFLVWDACFSRFNYLRKTNNTESRQTTTVSVLERTDRRISNFMRL
jgi:hypothetical protein